MTPPKPKPPDPCETDSDGKLLGKRHHYDKANPPTLRGVAHNLGFSSKEISELERIYQNDFEVTKR